MKILNQKAVAPEFTQKALSIAHALDGRAVIASDIADARVEVTALEDGTGLSIVERLADGTEGEVYTITPPVAAGDDIDLAATSKRR
jgi:hypothetical protein